SSPAGLESAFLERGSHFFHLVRLFRSGITSRTKRDVRCSADSAPHSPNPFAVQGQVCFNRCGDRNRITLRNKVSANLARLGEHVTTSTQPNVDDFTVPEKILLAADNLEKLGQSPFTAESLIVAS